MMQSYKIGGFHPPYKQGTTPMTPYKPPYTITSKMLSLATSVGEALTKIEYEADKFITPQLRKKNRIKTSFRCLSINTLRIRFV